MPLPFNPLGIKLALYVELTLALFSTIGGLFSYNPVVFTIMLWAVYRQDDYESMFVSLTMITLSIVLDITTLSVMGPWDYYPGVMKFGMAMNIMGLLLKPWALYIVVNEFHNRGGDLNSYASFVNRSDAYEPMVDGPPNYQGFHAGAGAPDGGRSSASPGGVEKGYQSGVAQPTSPLAPTKTNDPDAAPF